VIGLDTNVLVRYLVQDDPAQSKIASRLIESLTPEAPGFIGSNALAEIVWVLEESYGLDRSGVALVIERLLQTGSLIVQDTELAWRALSRYRAGAADFSDYLIERTAAAAGCEETVTFDKKAARDADCGMRSLR
jgi:predicted nucleic-acid-binding protein